MTNTQSVVFDKLSLDKTRDYEFAADVALAAFPGTESNNGSKRNVLFGRVLSEADYEFTAETDRAQDLMAGRAVRWTLENWSNVRDTNLQSRATNVLDGVLFAPRSEVPTHA
ncbi:MAG: hypothetical protein UY35_C0020G0014 [Candidatus Saccharibacteria bacterium GW2011_GWC2_48_9]|nr:MAG: hypothetical protein UY35_C0020G0014 [Candidatus Saccharibacteria bacterium GW2011_GWC2_48_9]HCH34636.1 hypothetical protein [Candidatus Saccharibacteria bacterium]